MSTLLNDRKFAIILQEFVFMFTAGIRQLVKGFKVDKGTK